MEIRHNHHQDEAKHFTTDQLREKFLIEDLFTDDQVKMVYSHIDRVIVGGAKPIKQSLKVEAGKEIGADFFLQNREMGIINVGEAGMVTADGTEYAIGREECVYLPKGTKTIELKSNDSHQPAYFYFLSCPAHAVLPLKQLTKADARKVELGSRETSNERVINQYLHPAVMETCQLSMGITDLAPGSIWNTMPTHTHERRMEVYFYFKLPEDHVVFHLMGEPQETRHIVVREKQAILSPSWSIHSGAGSAAYSFIWGMAGENKTFDDMDAVAMQDIR